MFKKILTIALCAIILAGTCVIPAKATTMDTIRIGVTGRMEPLMFMDEKGNVHGIFVDLMEAVASDAGMETEYFAYKAHRQALADLDAGNIDAVLGVLPGEADTFENVIVSEELYASSVCIVMPHEPDPEMSLSVGAFELDTITFDHAELMGADVINVFSTQAQVYESLIEGKASSIIAIPECIRYMLKRDKLENEYTIGTSSISGLSYCIGLNRNNTIISSNINKAIGRIRTTNEYKSIISKWGASSELEQANKTLKIVELVAACVALVTLVIVFFNLRLRSLVKAKTADLSEKIHDLENSSDLRNTLIEHGNAGSMVVKLDGTILLMNDAMRRLAGLEAGDPLPNVSELGIINRAWEAATDEMEQPELISETAPDGKVHTYRYLNHLTAKRDERVFMMRDVTSEENERQEEFEESKNKALNRIIAGIAHEVKNPLTTIRTYASLAETETGDPEFIQAFTEYVPKEVDRISDLIETLVNYSRPVHTDKELFAASEVAQSCLGLAYVYSKKIEISSEIDDTASLYMGKDQYRQVLINFLINAIQSVEEKQERGIEGPVGVALRIYRKDDEVVTEVRDTGIGMSEEQLRQCTEPFYTTKKKGTGMGLALAKQFIKENGGRFEIESEEGVGTSVRMVFAEKTTEDTDNE